MVAGRHAGRTGRDQRVLPAARQVAQGLREARLGADRRVALDQGRPRLPIDVDGLRYRRPLMS